MKVIKKEYPDFMKKYAEYLINKNLEGQTMATDRQTPCLYYVCAGLCTKGRKADHAHYCQHCNKYKPRARVRYKNHKKEKLEKIRRNEKYD